MGSRILFAGGGTGGHLFPGIAVAEELLNNNSALEIIFAGSRRGIEQEIINQTPYEHLAIEIEPSTEFRRHPVRFLWRFKQACRQAAIELKRIDPQVVVGLGGFASLPFMWAAHRQKRPAILLEQNIIAGRATRFCSHWAHKVCLSFPDTKGKLSRRIEKVVTGNPVRKEIREIALQTPEQNHKPKLIILGGSQGSVSLNKFVLQAYVDLKSELAGWEIWHQTGVQDYETVEKQLNELGLNITCAPFFQQPEDLYRGATLAVCRAGATTLAELALVGIPAILIPYPYALADHQTANARYYEQHGGALVLPESELQMDAGNPSEPLTNPLSKLLKSLIQDSQQRMEMARSMSNLAYPEAARKVAELIQNYLD
ncbi:MAG: undecaprenyldiphospho-muramoylpentapeptide beta-N-acetylglucosaminyltransferase [Planctomycetaceae bacterium]